MILTHWSASIFEQYWPLLYFKGEGETAAVIFLTIQELAFVCFTFIFERY